jgi:hypothetical protein
MKRTKIPITSSGSEPATLWLVSNIEAQERSYKFVTAPKMAVLVWVSESPAGVCLQGTRTKGPAVKPLPNESKSLKWAIKVSRRIADGFASLPVGDKRDRRG